MDEEDIFAEEFQEYFSDAPSSCESENNDSDSDIEESSDSDIFPIRKRCTRIPSYAVSDSDLNQNIANANENESDCVWNERDTPPQLETFEGTPGMVMNPGKSENIADIISLFFNEDFFVYLCRETNRYYHQQKHRYKIVKNIFKWVDVTSPEMKRFIGILILMGQVKKGTLRSYWSTDPLIETPIFGKIMSRKRFDQIWTFWHFSDNTQITPDADRLIKIQPLLDHFIPKFQEFYKPNREISLDECIIPWRGRLLFRTYNPAKIIKYGLLVRAVCESKSGYVINIEIYSGIGKKLQDTMFSVLRPVFDKWHHLYQDNYYNSVKTAKLLLQKKIRVCGTIRLNRGLPTELKTCMGKMKKGEICFRRKDDVLLLIFQHIREVKMISTIHSADIITTEKLDRKTNEYIKKPLCITEYNKYMKGVDQADQYLSYYSILRKTVKWTKKTAMYIINTALFNNFIMYNAVNQTKKKKYKDYLLSVARIWTTAEIDEAQPTTSRATVATID